MRTQFAPVCLVGLSLACAPAPRSEPMPAPTRLQLTFTAQADSFRVAAREYDSLWTSDAVRITRALEAAALPLGFRPVEPDAPIARFQFLAALANQFHRHFCLTMEVSCHD